MGSRDRPSFLGRTGMGLVVCLSQALFRHVRVNLGCGQRRVAEECLDTAKICACIEEVSGEGVSEFVRRNIERNIGMPEVFFQQAIYRAGGEALAQLGYKQRPICHLGGLTVGLDRLHGVRSDRNETLLRTFANYSQGI